jgi:pimeloyl-ACP methyl ester carboxylesterase
MKPITISVLFITLCLFMACHNSESDKPMRPGNKYKEGFIESEKVKLHYLDWGGKGQILVLICGLGDTPYIFENLAEALSDSFHIIGYSRRSHGQSKAFDENYKNAALVSDLKLLLDSLKIDKANLLGWSLGGNEITEFASLFPNRVNKLIYFESGYDLSDGGFEKLMANMKPLLPDSSVMTSLDNYREWYHRFWFGDMDWNTILETNLRASTYVKNDGSVETIPNDSVFNKILKEAMNYRRRYESVQAPSLVIYTKPFFHPIDNNPSTLQLFDSLENNIVSPWRSINKKRMEKELRNPIIVEAPYGSHASFLFLSNDFLVKTINSFLDDKQ